MIMRKRTKITEQMTQEIRDMYATREFTQNEIAGKFGISITAVNNSIHKGYVPKPKGMTETKERTELIEEHIMESFDNDVDALVGTIKANMFGNRTVKQACYEVVQGGCLLVYYNTVNDFLKELNCQLSDNDETNWSMYKKLVVNRMEKMYEKYTK